MKNVAIPLEKQNLAVMQAMDYRTYDYAFFPEEYTKMAKKGTMLSCMAMVNERPVGFAIWERGPRKSPAHIVRFGVIPNLRRRGVGRQMLDWLIDDLKRHRKTSLRSILSHVTCLGPNDPDDVSGFMTKMGFKWVDTIDKAYFQYGNNEDGIVFEREL